MANTLQLGNGKWATGKDTLLGYNSENNNIKPLPFDFSRASSATVVNQSGLIETVGSGEPRIDFKDNTKGALLLEPQRTNMIPYSEDFSNSSWAKTNCAITPNNSISPDGTQNADKLDFTSSSGEINRSLIVNSGQEYILSFYAKTESGTLNFNYGNISYVIVGGIATTEWQRFEIVQTAAASTRFPKIQTTEIGSLLLYGFQVEEGSYATSYIPTSGQSGGVTRVAETCTNGANAQVINSTEGVLYAEISALYDDGIFRYITLSDGTTSNRVIMRYTSVSNRIDGIIIVGGVTSALLTYTSPDVTVNSKISVKWKVNDFALWVDGIERASDLSGVSFTANTLNVLNLTNAVGTGSFFHGNVKDVRVYNTALTDAELQALTS